MDQELDHNTHIFHIFRDRKKRLSGRKSAFRNGVIFNEKEISDPIFMAKIAFNRGQINAEF